MVIYDYQVDMKKVYQMQNTLWQIGKIVKFGSLLLRVTSFTTKNKYIPVIYWLESIDKKYQYEYIPRKGLFRIN